MEELFQNWDRPDSPGAAVMVMRDGEVLLQRGYGMANLEYGIPITPATIFHVASTSKQFTAFSVVLLEQQGKLSLDDDVRKHVPELPDLGSVITIRHLMHHTSGMRDHLELLALAGWRLDDVISRDHILKILVRQRALNFEPGSEFLYSNTGYFLLAEVVERVTETTFQDWTAQNIFEPLEMKHTHFHSDHEHIVKNRAYSYEPDREGYKNSVLSYAYTGSTSLFTTVEDLGKWVNNFETGRVGGIGAVRRMLESGTLNNGDTLAYTFGNLVGRHNGLKTVYHGGSDAGFNCMLLRYPEARFAVAVLSNAADFDADLVAHRISEIYLAESMRRDKNPADYVFQVDVGNSASNTGSGPLEVYEGDYYSEELETSYSVEAAGDSLLIRHIRQEDMALTAVGNDEFVVTFFGKLAAIPPGYVRVRFLRGHLNQVTGLFVNTGRVRDMSFGKMDYN